MHVRMNKGDIAVVRDQVVIYDEVGIALRLTSGNLAMVQQAKITQRMKRQEDAKRRKFTVTHDRKARKFNFDTSSAHIEIDEGMFDNIGG